jgi:hypothetical protein
VLHDTANNQCSFLDGDASKRRCTWPGPLELTLDARGGRFTQVVEVEAEALFGLPGEAGQWPIEVRVDGRSAAVLGDDDRPVLPLAPGRHAIEGRFAWRSAPEVLRVPAETGLLRLVLNGARVDFPNRDADGRLWLGSGGEDAREAGTQDTVEVTVHRRIDDDVPLLLETHLALQVSGRARELVLGPLLPAGFAPMRLSAPLPARIEADGRLRVQVRPGSFVVEVTARHAGPVDAITAPGPVLTPAGQMPWSEEVWTLTAHTALRQVEVSGVASVDPSQTRLPEAWRALPAWVVSPGETLTLRTLRRGDPVPPPDRLRMARSLWLDADGAGYTVRDSMGGVLTTAWRLDASAPLVPGRVNVNGRDQLITRDGAEGPSGVELREGPVQLLADSRIEGAARTLPAVGWAHDFEQLRVTLHLAPGWRLFDASGVDDVPVTWLRTWSLFDLFLLLVTSLAVARLHGRVWGGVALLTLTLTIPEDDAPYTIWLVVVALHALVAALPVGRVRQVVRVGWWGAALSLVVIVLPFMIQQVRVANYPVLEHRWQRLAGDGREPMVMMTSASDGAAAPAAPAAQDFEAAAEEAFGEAQEKAEELSNLEIEATKSNTRGYVQRALKSAPLKKNAQVDVDPQAAVQTGPGLPQWTWNQYELRWSGPVQRGQVLELTLIPPWLSRLLGWARAGLVAALGLCILALVRRRGTPWPGTFDALPPSPEAGPTPPDSGSTPPEAGPESPTAPASAPAVPTVSAAALVVACVALGLLTSVTPAAAAEGPQSSVPSAEVLQTLRERLLADPLCAPHCVDVSTMRLDARAGRLRLDLDVSAAAATAIRLPAGDFAVERVSLGGAPGLVLRDAGVEWVRVPAGVHVLRLEGALSTEDTIDLTLPSRPRRVLAELSGYTLEGLDESGAPQETLQLVRVARPQAAEPSAPESADAIPESVLPAFGRIERTLSLGLQWTAETRVVRTSPPGAPLVLQVPLLPGESVTTAGVEVKDGRALVSLGPDAESVAWTSVLAPAERVVLKALDAQPATEVWRLDVSPIWHVDTQGVPVTRVEGDDRVRRPEWRPWPGEQLELIAHRPPPLDGATLTVDSARLLVRPGVRAASYTLSLTPRTSRGGPWGFELPPGARVQSVRLNNVEQPVSAESARVDVALSPGVNPMVVTWQADDALDVRIESPEVRVGDRLVNVEVTVELPADRWLLLTGGGQYGHAILFWSVLAVLVIVSLGLSRVPGPPLGFGAWLALGLGISQTALPAAIVVVAWLFALAFRARCTPHDTPRFNLLQVGIVCLTFAAAIVLVTSIQQGLLGQPDMQVAGNGSNASTLRFFSDRTAGQVPSVWVVSLPVTAYRALMLVWALWLAGALIRWTRWGWASFSAGGLWRGRTPAQGQGSGAP